MVATRPIAGGPLPRTLGHRRGFTMLEVAMAAALGAVVVLTALGVFFQIDRTESILAARSEDSNELSKLRLVVQRVTSNFVMSSEPQPQKDPPAGDGTRTAPSKPARDTGAPPPPPRFILEPDSEVAGAVMRATGGGDWAAEGGRPQRFEVVVTDSPVPQDENDIFMRAGMNAGADGPRKAYVRGDVTKRREMAAKQQGDGKGSGASSKDRMSTRGSSARDDKGSAKGGKSADRDRDNRQPDAITDPSESGDSAPVRAVRGAFELRPQAPSNVQIRKAQARGETIEPAWEMWWVPLPPRTNGDLSDVSLELAGDPFLVASNLRFAKWTMFDDRAKKTAMTATWEQQLPAYVELEVETTSGLTANWMFEVDWGRGPEVPAPPAETGTKKAVPVDGDSTPAGGSKPSGAGGAKQIGPSRSQPRSGKSSSGPAFGKP